MANAVDEDPPPVPPVRPDNDQCCGAGCNPCIFDSYQEARERYEAALAAWRKRRGLEDDESGSEPRVT